MIVKAIEIRDRDNACISAIAINMVSANKAQRHLLDRVGFHGREILLVRLYDRRACSDPHDWAGNRTLPIAHLWLAEHFDEIQDSGVVDVEFILGETETPKPPERLEGDAP